MLDKLTRSIDEFGNNVISTLSNIQNAFGRELSVKQPVKNNILQMVGNTPLIKLNSIGGHLNNFDFFLKSEFTNPLGSVKDRTALAMVMDAERRGHLRQGITIVQVGTDPIARSITWVGKLKGYKVITLVSDKENHESKKLLTSLGSEVIPVNADSQKDLLLYKIKNYPERSLFWYANEYKNMSNPNIHYSTTGPEIYRDLNGEVHAFIAGGGSGGTITGVGRFLKSKNRSTKIVMAVLDQSNYLKLNESNDLDFPETFDPKVIDTYYGVKQEEALLYQSELYQKEGIFVGATTGTTLAGAVKFAESISSQTDLTDKKFNIVVLSPDRD